MKHIFFFSTEYSSVGRAVDCRSIGHLFESGYSESIKVDLIQHIMITLVLLTVFYSTVGVVVTF